MTERKSYLFPFVGCSLSIYALDQFTKWLVQSRFQLYESIPVLGDFFRLTFIYNENAAFGISLGQNFPYSLVAVLVVGLLIYLFLTHARYYLLTTLSLGLILGGAIGNLTDRIRFGKVVDFLDCEFFDINLPPISLGFIDFPGYIMHRWPVFNVADSAISVGVTLLFVIMIFFPDDPSAASDENTANSTAALPHPDPNHSSVTST